MKIVRPDTPMSWFGVVFAVGVLVVVAGLGAWGFVSDLRSGAESDEVLEALEIAYADPSALPSPLDLQAGFVEAWDGNEVDPGFPVPDGATLYQWAPEMESSIVNLQFRGESQAAGWCFDVTYGDDVDTLTSKEEC